MPSQPICPPADLATWIADQRGAIAELEQALWRGGFHESLLAPYQAAFRELENLIAAAGDHRRHRFIIIIPVADSPLHLRDCLASLLELCRAYGYGGQVEGRWQKVSVLLADDSGDAACIDAQRGIAAEFDRQGLSVEYFGLEEQIALLERVATAPPVAQASSLHRTSDQMNEQAGGLRYRGGWGPLDGIIGIHSPDAFHHKGQGMMRNVAYLRLAELAAADVLFYSIDADQEFKVKVATERGDREVAALNFLFLLDEIFSRGEVDILTGKVVGDPPVSPAVMAGNFLEDVRGFLTDMAAGAPRQAYRQPNRVDVGKGDAAYHDMADLFGFKHNDDAYRYHCGLAGTPDNAACFAEFAGRLNSFFHGEHPTRITWYDYQDALASVQPARTIYTGNYAFRPEALNWFIPFAPLRLRMSGPTMGRLLKAELGARFVSANLPMLHKRTVEATGASEFRPGVNAARERIDLCGEFERQFHGDVMLFSMQRLTELGYPARDLDAGQVTATLDALRGEMREKYRAKQEAILERLGQVQALLADPVHWWNQTPDCAEAVADFQSFAANIVHNFGADSPCYALIDAPGIWESWRGRQLAAILGLQADRAAWDEALRRLAPSPLGGGLG